jgi:DNA polymerase-3 subunit beta
MKFKVHRTRFFQQLQTLQTVAERKSTLPILQNVLIRASTEPMGVGEGKPVGHLELTGSDSEVTVVTNCPAEVEEAGLSTLNVRKLFEITRLLPSEDVSFHLKEARGMEIRSGQSQFRMPISSPEDFPRIPRLPDIEPVCLDFHTVQSMIRRVDFATAGEDTRYVYSGSLMTSRGEDLEMAATDGHRLSVVRARSEAWLGGKKKKKVKEEIRIIIPKKALLNLERAEVDEDGVLDFWQGDNHLFFRSGNWLLVCNSVEGNFAPYEKVVPSGNDKSVQVLKNELMDSVRRVGLMSGEKSNLIEFALRPGKLELSSREASQGEAREEIDVEFKGKPIRIGFNAGYLSEFLSVVGSERVRIDLKDPQAAGLFSPAEENPSLDYTYVVMPMHFGQNEE